MEGVGSVKAGWVSLAVTCASLSSCLPSSGWLAARNRLQLSVDGYKASDNITRRKLSWKWWKGRTGVALG